MIPGSLTPVSALQLGEARAPKLLRIGARLAAISGRFFLPDFRVLCFLISSFCSLF